MTSVIVKPPPTPDRPPRERTLPSWLTSRRSQLVFFGLLGVLLISITQSFATPSTGQLSSSSTWSTALAFSVPVLLAGMGGLYSERSGVVNIGLEGMLVLGTFFGAWGGYEFGPWWGLAIGILGGAAGGLLHAVATVGFGVDHIVSGVAINILAPGVARFLADQLFTGVPGGSITQSPRVQGVSEVSMPFLAGGAGTADILGRIESWDWFFVSDLAGILRGFMVDISWFTLLAYALVPFTVWLLWRTRFGLRLRSCGENPVAADSLGVDVYRYKFIAVTMSGALAGFGGAFLVIELTGIYKEGQTGGRGFIGLATMIFGNWQPVGQAAGAVLFGFTDVLQVRDRPAAHALLLLVAMVLAAAAIWSLVRGQRWMGALYGSGAALVFAWYALTDSVPVQFPPVIPHFAVIFVLLFARRRLRMPAADGLRYRRGMQL